MTVIGTINNVQSIAPNPSDVLCGAAGKAIMSHPGNKVFRALVRESVRDYSESDNMKAIIRKNIVNAILANNGRFLMQERSDKSWRILSWQEAEGKTAQALRDAGTHAYRTSRNNSSFLY